MNFIKKIVDNNVDESVHRQFVRFGKGNYAGRFKIQLRQSKKIKIKTSFEFANDLVALCSRLGSATVSGIALSKQNISSLMSEKNIKGNSEEKKGGLFYLNNVDSQELSSEQLGVLEKESYFTLLDIEGADFKLKIKKKLPKPGKSAEKVDDKFCQFDGDVKYALEIKKDFFWDMPDAKKITIAHEVIVDEIVVSDELKATKDFARIKEEAKRKGKIIRVGDIDGEIIKKEIEFEV